ncbi:BON domain-containing protein [Chitinophaga sancti]|uniref:BON domain-containing protein n=1 Tax=Chitinophaga sancti TaxID=1004 RepID=A0A1K1RIJ4_9BACT|nr:BON domain-containing protein [Chitinophaga sancti]WQD60645.1 BON domain-containing protein [Chitinophaga sancti]WQG87227.1 BON domain-containing protein [Chitinophaga sancti]SFW71660.1 BON domain-containing protein [Chitinophaga sancti]
MDRKSLLMAASLLVVPSLYSCQPGDDTVKLAVIDKLNNSPGISAEVKDGVVDLNGEVPNDSAKVAAEDAVKKVNGVKAVNNNIMVEPVIPTPPPMPEDTGGQQ